MLVDGPRAVASRAISWSTTSKSSMNTGRSASDGRAFACAWSSGRSPGIDWPVPLLGPYLERRIEGAAAGICAWPWRSSGMATRSVACGAIGCSDSSLGHGRADRPASGRQARGRRRPAMVSAAHAGDWTIAAAGPGTIACDLEPVAARPDSLWRDLLGPDRWELAGLIARRPASPDRAATRVWVAGECLTKAGVDRDGPDGPERLDRRPGRAPRVRTVPDRDVRRCPIGRSQAAAGARTPGEGPMMQGYEYRHIVGFEETNLVGNVYFVNHLRWQGRCRELFLRDHAPGVLAEMERGLAFVTTRVSCEYFEELAALDEIMIRMTLVSQAQNRLTMAFEYYRDSRRPRGARRPRRAAGRLHAPRRRRGWCRPRSLRELRDALRPFASTSI